MGAWEIAALVLGSGVVVALVNLLSERLKRKDAVVDRRSGTEEQLEELRAETTEQFEQVERRFAGIESKIDTVATSMTAIMQSGRAQAYDRIRHLGMAYIRAGVIGAEEYENLDEMHQAYKLLGGDGFLDKMMAEVKLLRIRVDD